MAWRNLRKPPWKCVWPGGISWWPMATAILIAPWWPWRKYQPNPWYFRNFGFQNKTLIPSQQLRPPFTLCTSLSLISASLPSGAPVTVSVLIPVTRLLAMTTHQQQGFLFRFLLLLLFCRLLFPSSILIIFFLFQSLFFLSPFLVLFQLFFFSFFLFCSILFFFPLLCFSLFSVQF